MDTDAVDLDRRLGVRLKATRQRLNLTLDELATRSGVSRAMISRVERGESSPTAALLDRLCAGLGIVLSALFRDEHGAGPLVRRDEQQVWTDPASGYRRRTVSPAGTGSRLEIVEVEMPAGARVLLEAQRAGFRLDQQFWLLEGELVIGLGEREHRLAAGDCLAMLLDGPISFHNPGAEPARYAVVLAAADNWSGRLT
ncbi:helix-turn-helix domain-containing protein [Bosea sp. PAMC 26642]|uniref:helix-turn-helix domain-containing protein n=1 Tax=Bosea sp. (strain PAMC 26642) TaxID=1792307 RepID=UPI00076FF01B|nr:XRE family transcriptional regulator [Bosea sp. PAMC 26642]AMJ59140.1 DNA-binding protein [Bosea sp. PAMC 26642]